MTGLINTGALAEYVRTVAFYMIFSALVEIIAPSGSFKKYIRLVLSLILIALLIEPLGGLLRGVPGLFEGNYLKFQGLLDNRMVNGEKEKYERENAETVINEYKKSLNVQTTQLIETRTGLSVSEARVVVNEDYGSEAFAGVLGVHVTVKIPAREEEASAAKKILFGNASAEISGDEIKMAAEQKIKNCLMDFYNVSDGNIYITVLDD